MQMPQQIAKQLRDVCFGGNWTAVNLRDALTGLTWQQAVTPVYSLNTIATLVYHMGYYVSGVLKVLQGGPLDIKDKYSFDHPPIRSQEDWIEFLEKTWADVEAFAASIEKLPEEQLWSDFADGTYGHYYRNLTGIVEHIHYHLGQVVVIRKISDQMENKSDLNE